MAAFSMAILNFQRRVVGAPPPRLPTGTLSAGRRQIIVGIGQRDRPIVIRCGGLVHSAADVQALENGGDRLQVILQGDQVLNRRGAGPDSPPSSWCSAAVQDMTKDCWLQASFGLGTEFWPAAWLRCNTSETIPTPCWPTVCLPPVTELSSVH